MKFNLMRFIATLFCLVALLLCISSPVFAGQGCGTNWLGSDSNDKDFYVSKNQNQGASGIGTGVSAASASNSGQSSGAQSLSLTPDKPGPQIAGTTINWTADSGRQETLYKFLLKGPSTEGTLIEKTGWTADNTWTWNTTAMDVGENQVEVRVKYSTHIGSDANGYDQSKAASYVITTQEVKDVTPPAPVDPNPHPKAHTDSPIEKKTTKPRIAPDERPKTIPTNPSGPNMSMPDPTPKPLAVSEDMATDTAAETDAVNVDSSVDESTSELSEPETDVMDLGGKWTVEFEGLGSSLELVMIQTGDRLMGSGTLNKGETKIPVTASGSISRDKMKLDAKTVVGEYVNKIDERYKIDLSKKNGAFSGSYEAYAGEKFTGKGNATASKPGL